MQVRVSRLSKCFFYGVTLVDGEESYKVSSESEEAGTL